MITDTLSIVSWRSRPRSFVALMSLYESNYLRLASLAGDLRRLHKAGQLSDEEFEKAKAGMIAAAQATAQRKEEEKKNVRDLGLR